MENNELNKLIHEKLANIENELKEMQVEISWLTNKVDTLSKQSLENIEDVMEVKKSLEKANLRIKNLEYSFS